MADNTTSEKIGDARGPEWGGSAEKKDQAAGAEDQDFGDALEEAIETEPSLKMEKKIKDKLTG